MCMQSIEMRHQLMQRGFAGGADLMDLQHGLSMKHS